MVIKVGEIYETNNFGTLEVIGYTNAKTVRIRFLDTGSERTTEAVQIRKGQVKDLFKPIVYGVGYMGAGPYTARVAKKKSREYIAWSSMLSRCYDETVQKARPSYIGCTVVPEWHNFQVFAKWCEENYVEGFDLDKDSKIPGNKIYGPDTCVFLPPGDNSIQARAISTTFISPSGEVTPVYNIAEFARELGIHSSGLYRVYEGRSKEYRGWTKLITQET